MNFPAPPGMIVTHVKETQHDIEVAAACEDAEPPSYCPKCCTLTAKVYKHGTTKQLLMDLPVHGKRVGITLTRDRYRCQDCGKTFVRPLSGLKDGSQMTERLIRYIQEQSLRKTFTAVSDEVGVDEKTVRNLFKAFVQRLDAETIFETPKRMGIDEVHLLRKPRCVMTNLKEATIFAVLAERTKKVVTAYLTAMPDRDKVEVVTMDMWAPYYDAVTVAMPQAVVVVDKFHVVKMASESMERVRKSFRAGLDIKARRKLMHDRFILLRRNKDLDDRQRTTLNLWTELFPPLSGAYLLKEDFFDIYDLSEKEDAQEAFRIWEKQVNEQGLVLEFKPLLTAVYNWWDQIFAYWDFQETNALTEALNGVAKMTQLMGRGYSFDVIRAKLLYSKAVQKEARRPKFGDDSVGRALPHEVRGTTWGVDIARLLSLLEAESGGSGGSAVPTKPKRSK